MRCLLPGEVLIAEMSPGVDVGGGARSLGGGGCPLAAGTLEATLQQIVALAVVAVEGCDAAGILLAEDEQLTTIASSDPIVIELDRQPGPGAPSPVPPRLVLLVHGLAETHLAWMGRDGDRRTWSYAMSSNPDAVGPESATTPGGTSPRSASRSAGSSSARPGSTSLPSLRSASAERAGPLIMKMGHPPRR